MLTKKVKFNGVDYNVRNNMLSKKIYLESITSMAITDEHEGMIVYMWSLLKGYNLGFNMSYDEFLMNFDDDSNKQFLIDVTNLLVESNESNEENKEDDEKK